MARLFARYFGVAAVLTIITLTVGLIAGGANALRTLVVLGIVEVCLSFDNAVANAKVLGKMNAFWRRAFLYVGIFIAVFVMRAFLPLLLVAVTAHLGLGEVIDLALNHSEEYAHHIEMAAPAIFSYGGTFLLMVFLNFVLDKEGEKEVHWLGWLERPLARIGKLDTAAVLIALGAIAVGSLMAPEKDVTTVWVSGAAGLATYLIVQILGQILDGGSDEDGEDATSGTGNMVTGAATAGIGAFLYLEILDMSFSFDGVIGAFAISTNIFLILAGLGIGAFWIRSLTLFMVDRGTLEAFRYLEHGAMWAIGVLSGIMFAELRWHVSEWVTGSVGLLLIIAAIISSVVATRREKAAGTVDSADDETEKALV
jgi:hypothetical protein